jgi:hypothetical protein
MAAGGPPTLPTDAVKFVEAVHLARVALLHEHGHLVSIPRAA